MDIREAAIDRLLAADPRRGIEETLTQVVIEAQAEAAAVFVGGGEATLVWGIGVDQACLERVRRAWREETARLRAERPVWQTSWCVWPCGSGPEAILVYLAGSALKVGSVRTAIEGVSSLLRALVAYGVERGDARAGTDVGNIDGYLKATPREAVEKRQLLVLLNEAEWNVARVARALGVTRVTVYKRMRRFGIARLRISKARGGRLASEA